MNRKNALPTLSFTPVIWVRVAWLLALAVIVVSLFRYERADGNRDYVDDEGIYTYVGWAWGQGDVPYVKSWDHKGPVTFLITRARTHFFDTSPRFLVVQEEVLGVATAAAAAGVAALLWGWLPAAVAGGASILLWSARPPDFGHMSTVGSAIALFSVLALLLALVSETRASSSPTLLVLAGVVAGLAAWTKPNALSGLVLAGLVIISTRRRESWLSVLRGLLLTAAGFALISVVFVALMVRWNALREFYDVVLRFNSLRTPILLKSIGLVTVVNHALRILWDMGLAPLLGLIALAASLLLLRRSWMRKTLGLEVRELEWVVFAGVVLEVLTLVSNGSYRHHVYQLLTPLALATAWLVSLVERTNVPARAVSIVVVTFVALGMPFVAVARLRPRLLSPTIRSDDVAKWLDTNTSPNEKLLTFVDPGAPGLLAIAHRRAASRYMYSVPLYLPGYTSDARWQEVVRILSDRATSFPLLVNDEWHGESADSVTTRRAMINRRIDYPWLPDRFVDTTHFVEREKVKAMIAKDFSFVSCRRSLCLMRRNDVATAAASAHTVGSSQ